MPESTGANRAMSSIRLLVCRTPHPASTHLLATRIFWKHFRTLPVSSIASILESQRAVARLANAETPFRYHACQTDGGGVALHARLPATVQGEIRAGGWGGERGGTLFSVLFWR